MEIKIKVNKKPPKEINLRDFIWEEEEFQFNPKVNRHKKFLHSKKRQLEKENFANIKKQQNLDSIVLDEHQRYISKIEESLLQDYYDREDEEEYKGYRIK